MPYHEHTQHVYVSRCLLSIWLCAFELLRTLVAATLSAHCGLHVQLLPVSLGELPQVQFMGTAVICKPLLALWAARAIVGHPPRNLVHLRCGAHCKLTRVYTDGHARHTEKEIKLYIEAK